MIKFYRLKYEGDLCYVQRRGVFSNWEDYYHWALTVEAAIEFFNYELSTERFAFRCKSVGTPSISTICDKVLKEHADKFAENILKNNNLLNRIKDRK
jgi:hypothetical protein